MLKMHEGLRLEVYDDATGKPLEQGDTIEGHPTIGYGRNLTKAMGISLAEANHLLENDIQRVQGELIHTFPWYVTLSPCRAAVLHDMCHHMGLNRLLKFRRMLAAIESGDFKEASHQLLDSKYARTPELSTRAHRNAKMLQSNRVPHELSPVKPSRYNRPPSN